MIIKLSIPTSSFTDLVDYGQQNYEPIYETGDIRHDNFNKKTMKSNCTITQNV